MYKPWGDRRLIFVHLPNVVLQRIHFCRLVVSICFSCDNLSCDKMLLTRRLSWPGQSGLLNYWTQMRISYFAFRWSAVSESHPFGYSQASRLKYARGESREKYDIIDCRCRSCRGKCCCLPSFSKIWPNTVQYRHCGYYRKFLGHRWTSLQSCK